VSLLIKKAKAPVVPVGIAGAYEAWPRWRPYPIPAPLFLPEQKAKIALSIGPALDGRQLAELPREKLLASLFQVLSQAQNQAERLRKRKKYCSQA
jgi:1-acyl-sn-glycerol-3-phosphate acyltransferase